MLVVGVSLRLIHICKVYSWSFVLHNRFCSGKDRLLKSDYLYQPSNNIELGCAYLSKNRYRYFGGIKDDEKAYLCTICAYNTGPGNVAKALTGVTSLQAAVKVVNQHDTDWVRRKLLRDLPYKETKDYLNRISGRRLMYAKWM